MANQPWTGKKPVNQIEKSVDVLSQLSWTVQPPLGLISGDYYREENDFAPHFAADRGYHGILEAVCREGKLVHVEFNELCSPAYYARIYQNASKRRSDYCFYQATKERTAQSLKVLDNGFTDVERQMLAENRLVGDFDLTAGASNSVKRSLLPLAAKINAMLSQPNAKRYYGYAEKLAGGITARLEVVVESGRILRCFYDEIFADTPEEIENPRLKQYYRQSKQHCLQYESDYPDGFNTLFGLLEQRVLLTQNLLDISGLPWAQDSEKRKHNGEFDTYLRLANIIRDAAAQDGYTL